MLRLLAGIYRVRKLADSVSYPGDCSGNTFHCAGGASTPSARASTVYRCGHSRHALQDALKNGT